MVVTRKSQDEDRPSRQLDSDGDEDDDDASKVMINSNDDKNVSHLLNQEMQDTCKPKSRPSSFFQNKSK